MRRKDATACLVLALTLGCSLSDEECLTLRSEAFEVINGSHTCNDDVDCVLTEWPECPRPSSKKNMEKVTELKAKFDKGSCSEPPPARACEIPEVYCKQGLCVFRHQRGDAPTQ
jgi:hypothetical protein